MKFGGEMSGFFKWVASRPVVIVPVALAGILVFLQFRSDTSIEEQSKVDSSDPTFMLTTEPTLSAALELQVPENLFDMRSVRESPTTTSGSLFGPRAEQPEVSQQPEETENLTPTATSGIVTSTSAPDLVTAAPSATTTTNRDLSPTTRQITTTTSRAVTTCQPRWTETFSDDFNATEVASDSWYIWNSAGHLGNGVRRPGAVEINDGILEITAQQQGSQIVSGGISTKYQQRYGRFEARVRFEGDPSGAMVASVLAYDRSLITNGIMVDFYSAKQATRFNSEIYELDEATKIFSHGSAASNEWHVIGVDWSDGLVEIRRDGVVVKSYPDIDAATGEKHQMALKLDALKAEMGSPVTMYVDWVRISELASTC